MAIVVPLFCYLRLLFHLAFPETLVSDLVDVRLYLSRHIKQAQVPTQGDKRYCLPLSEHKAILAAKPGACMVSDDLFECGIADNAACGEIHASLRHRFPGGFPVVRHGLLHPLTSHCIDDICVQLLPCMDEHKATI